MELGDRIGSDDDAEVCDETSVARKSINSLNEFLSFRKPQV